MSQFYREDGTVVPVTVLHVPRNVILQKKQIEGDGYEAVQIGAGDRREQLVSKPQRGHFGELGSFRFVCEFRGDQLAGARSDEIGVDQFVVGDRVTVSGTSKGKGFQGVIKRHGFHGSSQTHGHRHNVRKGGSIGATGLNRVIKGMKMPGRMGGDRTTVKNLEIVHIDAENHKLLVRGAIPGIPGSMIELYKK